MSKLIRFGVSLSESLLKDFDLYLKKREYSNRSEAIRDLIRNELVKEEWETGGEIAGAITITYDHHKRELMQKMTNLQHDFHSSIISTQHIHLDHDNCLEILAIKGDPDSIKTLFNSLKAIKGIKHTTLSMSSTGKKI